MAQIYLAVTVLVVLVLSQGVAAKRGCSSFGHSCFGGHGKRSGDTNILDTSSELMGRRQMGQEETPPHPVYPHSGYSGLLPPGDDMIPVRDGGVFDREDTVRDAALKLKLRNVVRHWMENMRRSQQNIEDGYVMDNL